MKILVTGGNGYVGSALVRSLSGRHEVSVLSSESGGDIRDPTVDLSQYDILFHLAATSSPKSVEADRNLAWDINVNGTLNICRKLKSGQRIVFISSAQVYDKKSGKTHIEEELPRPNNFYGLTKLVGEEIVRFHSLQAGFGYVIFRLFNVYSEDQPPGLLVGDVMEKYKKSEIVEVYNPQAVLDMVHLEDVVTVLSSFERIQQGTYNLCSGHPITVDEIYDRIGRYLGKAKQKKIISDRKDHLLGDNSRLGSLGFSFRPFKVGK